MERKIPLSIDQVQTICYQYKQYYNKYRTHQSLNGKSTINNSNNIQASIKKLAKNRTVFIISQRPSTLKLADRLIIVDHGRIAQIGTYEHLSQAEGVFSALLKKNDFKIEDLDTRSQCLYVV